jgi:hypothetical protein
MAVLMQRPRLGKLAAFFVLLGLVLIVVSCGDGGDETSAGSDADGNIFINPGLEEGSEPWASMTAAVNPDPLLHFVRTEDVAHSGTASALLRMRDGAEAGGDARVYYLVQEVTPEEFPEVVSGFYNVQYWNKGTPRQYLQFVVIAFSSDNAPRDPSGVPFPNHQIRYILAGINSPPFPIANAHFVFISRDEPVLGEWISFERNIKEDFENLWGAAPVGFDRIRVLFEVRWDGKEPGSPSEADVFYDDLYIGPAPGAN